MRDRERGRGTERRMRGEKDGKRERKMDGDCRVEKKIGYKRGIRSDR
jgi:hypothetical protein